MPARSRTRRLAWALVALALLAAPPAAAHANLVDASPTPNTRLEEAPATLRLAFSEPLDETYTGVEVVGPNGTDRVRDVTIVGDRRTELSVDLAPLPDGRHTVRWRTLSAADGHTKSGIYLLAVNASLTPGDGAAEDDGTAAANATAPPPAGSTPGTGEAAVRGLAFLGAALGAGLPLVLLALPPGVAAPLPGRRLRGLAAGASGVATAAALGLLALLAARVGVDPAAAAFTANGTRVAWRAGLHGLAGLLLAGTLVTRDVRRRHALLGAGALAGAGGLLAASLGGHAAGLASGRILAFAADWLHQAAVAFWVAGVVVLLAGLTVDRPRERDVADLVARLSPAFVAAVAVIVLTGSYASWRHLGTPADLWTTGYGWALAAKILLLLPLVALGAYHRYRLLPRLRARAGGPTLPRLRRSVAAEVLLMVVVLGAAGALTNVSPPSQAGAGLPAPDAGADAGSGTAPEGLQGVVHAYNESGFQVRFAVTPQPVTVGAQNVTVEVDPPEEGFPGRADVVVNLKPPSDPYGEGETLDLTRWRNDTWSHEGPVFVESGEWRVLVALQGKDTYIQDTFRLDVR